jgi:predicted RNase H-like HicB family nuclease
VFHISHLKRTHPLAIKGSGLKPCVFRVVIEPDEDRWSAHSPALPTDGAATWRNPQEEARTHLQTVVQMVAEAWREDGDSIPEDLQASQAPLVAIPL